MEQRLFNSRRHAGCRMGGRSLLNRENAGERLPAPVVVISFAARPDVYLVAQGEIELAWFYR